MKLVVQRVTGARIRIERKVVSEINGGLVVLVGTRKGDRAESCGWLADKLVNLRIFEDDQGKMNRSALDTGGEILIVSQFTLYADCRKGRRPAFTEAQEPAEAERLYERFVELVSASDLITKTGKFGAEMQVELTNDGPVTIILEHNV